MRAAAVLPETRLMPSDTTDPAAADPAADPAAADPAAATDGRRRGSSRRTVALVVGLALAVPALGIGALAWLLVPDPVVTTVVDAQGRETELDWSEHPGRFGLPVDEVLAGPSLEEGVAEGEAMVDEMEAALTERFSVRWVAPPAGLSDDEVAFPTDNGWGGPSLLEVVNLPTEQTSSVPRSWDEKEAAVAIIGEVAARHGWSEPWFDDERWPQPAADRLAQTGGTTLAEQVIVSGGLEGPTGQWLSFTFQDLSKDDAEGTFAARFDDVADAGWEPESITLSYGANGLLPEARRAEFERRAEPFAGQVLPEAQED